MSIEGNSVSWRRWAEAQSRIRMRSGVVDETNDSAHSPSDSREVTIIYLFQTRLWSPGIRQGALETLTAHLGLISIAMPAARGGTFA
jgi:hypothetical protein